MEIPKLLLEQVDLGENVELALQENQIIIRPAFRVRQGWDQAFQAMAEAGDDKLLDDEGLLLTEWDEKDWEW